MRSLIALMLAAAAGLLAGCAYTGFYEPNGTHGHVALER